MWAWDLPIERLLGEGESMKANWNPATPVEQPATIADLIELDPGRSPDMHDLRESVEFLDVLGAAPETGTDEEEMWLPTAL